MAAEAKEESNHDGLKIINAGLFRTATKTMARAYQILGFNAHHGLLEDVTETPWTGIEHAAEATWPYVQESGAPLRPPFQRSDWDAVWGSKCKKCHLIGDPHVIYKLYSTLYQNKES